MKTLMNIHINIFYIIGLFAGISALLVNGIVLDNTLVLIFNLLTIGGLILWLICMIWLVHKVMYE